MKLADYIKDKGVSVRSWALGAGMNQQTVNRYVRGERFPTPEHIQVIHEQTRGAVDWLDWRDQYLSKASSRPKPTHSGER